MSDQLAEVLKHRSIYMPRAPRRTRSSRASGSGWPWHERHRDRHRRQRQPRRGQRIDIGWDRPVSMTDLAETATRLLGKQIRLRSIPPGLIHAMGAVLGPFVHMAKDMSAMVGWFDTRRYVADTTRQAEVVGPVPTAEDAVTRFANQLATRCADRPAARRQSSKGQSAYEG